MNTLEEMKIKRKKKKAFPYLSSYYSQDPSEQNSNFINTQRTPEETSLAIQVSQNKKMFDENRHIFSQFAERIKTSNGNMQSFVISQLSKILSMKQSLLEDDIDFLPQNKKQNSKKVRNENPWSSEDENDPFAKKSPLNRSKYRIFENEDFDGVDENKMQLYNSNKNWLFPFEENKSLNLFTLQSANDSSKQFATKNQEFPFGFEDFNMDVEDDDKLSFFTFGNQFHETLDGENNYEFAMEEEKE